MFDFLQICLRKAKPVCKIPHMFILADVWLLPNMFGKNQTRWYIYTWVLFSTHVWILTHRYGKRHTCVQKATQLYVCKCLTFSTHVWEKPLTCLFPPELWVLRWSDGQVYSKNKITLETLLASRYEARSITQVSTPAKLRDERAILPELPLPGSWPATTSPAGTRQGARPDEEEKKIMMQTTICHVKLQDWMHDNYYVYNDIMRLVEG